jgi:hypothetical protein
MEQATGGCLCGEVRYQFSGPKLDQLICHCRMCQKASGGPLGALVFIRRENLGITKGQLRVFASTSTTRRQFCQNCGSPLFFVRTNRPERISIFTGSLDDQTGVSPTMHVCAETAVPWLQLGDGLPRHGQKPPGMSPTVSYDPTTGHVVE